MQLNLYLGIRDIVFVIMLQISDLRSSMHSTWRPIRSHCRTNNAMCGLLVLTLLRKDIFLVLRLFPRTKNQM